MKSSNPLFKFILASVILFFVYGCAGAQEPCSSGSKDYYFGVEIDGMLCGYAVTKECSGLRDGKKTNIESTEILVKMSILGEGFDVTISNLMTTDPGSGTLTYTEYRIQQGNTTINSKSVIKGDTVSFSGTNSTGVKKIMLKPGVILEATLRSPSLVIDFVQNGIKVKRYEVYEMIKGEIIEKEYSVKGEEEITLNNQTYPVLVLEEFDLSTGVRATIWLNKKDGMVVKTLVAGRNIYLTDSNVVGRISKVNFDNIIFARVNRIIPEFQKVRYMKVQAKIESYGEIITPESLNFPGQKFTGTVAGNMVDGTFELEPLRYTGLNAPPFPPDFTKKEELKKFLEPETAIESNDPVLIKEAWRITEGSSDAWEAVKKLSAWVAHNIEGAIPGGGTAINTYKMREGECGGHSRLLTAFCRAVGIPARLSIGCMYSTHYGGSFGQHAWTEVYMGDAGWVAVDATIFETDYVDAGHIRLGEKTNFQPKLMEILEFRMEEGSNVTTDSVPLRYTSYIGKYTDLDRGRVFRIFYQDQGLSVDIPGQMIMALNEPDSSGQWYPKITRQMSLSFKQNTAGQSEKLAIRQKVSVPKQSSLDSLPRDVPDELLKYLGVYRFPQGNTRALSYSGGYLTMYDPVGRNIDPLKFTNEGSVWKEPSGMYEFSFETNETGEVAKMVLYVTFLFPRGEPATDVIEPLILESGADAGLRKLDELKASGTREYLFTEGLMNALGYRLLSKDKTADAIEVFKYNAKEYPESFNVYDSLGEAYYKQGNMDLAIKNFERSMELNPKNENGRAMLDKIRSEM